MIKASGISAKEIPIDELKLRYEYNSESPSGLVWKVPRFHARTNNIILRNIGDVVGYLDNHRWYVGLGYEKYLAHRVIWVMFNGEIPKGMYINHINCNPSDNRIENLELATPQQNCRKSKIHVLDVLSNLNTSGINGVHEEKTWNGTRTKLNYYARAYYHNEYGKAVRKSFAYSTYGKEEAWRLAEEFVKHERALVDIIVDERDCICTD